MEEGVKILKHVHEVISIGDFDYGSHRREAQGSVSAAKEHLEEALKHDTPEQRGKAAEHLEAAHVNVKKALAFSIEKYGLNDVKKEGGEPETRAAANRQLVEELPKIEFTYHLLRAVDHEIKDYKQEKKDQLKKRDEAKHQLKEQVAAQVKPIDEQIKALKK
jgi:hypothetical protein